MILRSDRLVNLVNELCSNAVGGKAEMSARGTQDPSTECPLVALSLAWAEVTRDPH
jgi:hypothetical protein